MRVLISMPEDFLSKVDNHAKHEMRTRSELIREAIRQYITAGKSKSNSKEN